MTCKSIWQKASIRTLQVVSFWLLKYVTFHRRRSTFQNVWRQSSGTKCTWTLTSNVLKNTPFPKERHELWCMWCYLGDGNFSKILTLKSRYRTIWNIDELVGFYNVFQNVWRQNSGTNCTRSLASTPCDSTLFLCKVI